MGIRTATNGALRLIGGLIRIIWNRFQRCNLQYSIADSTLCRSHMPGSGGSCTQRFTLCVDLLNKYRWFIRKPPCQLFGRERRDVFSGTRMLYLADNRRLLGI